MMVMRSRIFLIALPLLALAAPAAAQDVVFVSGTGDEIPVASFEDEGPAIDDRDNDIADIADRMDDPLVQDGISAGIERMAGAMMNVRVGPLAEAIERARPGTVDRRIRRDSTVGDLAGRDAEYLPERLGEQSREMMGMMGGFARAMATMMPEFERMGREMEESFRTAKAEARRNRN
jgi:hypothetical protein